MVRGGYKKGVDNADTEHPESVCSLWSPQGISGHAKGLGEEILVFEFLSL